MRQLIIVRKDLGMSTGKIAAQCCHASLAYFSAQMMCDLHKGLKAEYQYNPVYEMTKIKGSAPAWYRSPQMQEYQKRAMAEGKDVFYTRMTGRQTVEWVDEPEYEYRGRIAFPVDVYENWLNDIWTKTVCEAKNKGHLLKAVLMAEELGLNLIEAGHFFTEDPVCDYLAELICSADVNIETVYMKSCGLKLI